MHNLASYSENGSLQNKFHSCLVCDKSRFSVAVVLELCVKLVRMLFLGQSGVFGYQGRMKITERK